MLSSDSSNCLRASLRGHSETRERAPPTDLVVHGIASDPGHAFLSREAKVLVAGHAHLQVVGAVGQGLAQARRCLDRSQEAKYQM